MIFKGEFLYLRDRDSRWQKNFNNFGRNYFNCRVPLSSTHPSVQNISSTQKGLSFSAPRICQFNTKKASVQRTRYFNTKNRHKIAFVFKWRFLNIELNGVLNWCFLCWTDGYVELTHLTCWTDGFRGLKRIGPCVELRWSVLNKRLLKIVLFIMSHNLWVKVKLMANEEYITINYCTMAILIICRFHHIIWTISIQ